MSVKPSGLRLLCHCCKDGPAHPQPQVVAKLLEVEQSQQAAEVFMLLSVASIFQYLWKKASQKVRLMARVQAAYDSALSRAKRGIDKLISEFAYANSL